MPLTEFHMDVILNHLVRDPETIRKALPRLTDDVFDSAEGLLRTCWKISREYFQREQSPIPEPIFLAELMSANASNPAWTEEFIREQTRRIFDYDASGLRPGTVVPWISEFLVQRRTLPTMIAAQAGMLSAMEMVRQLQSATQSSMIGTVLLSEMSRDKENFFLHQPRKQTHCAPIDDILGGGIFQNQSYGLLGPTGGGKTTLAQSLMCEWVAQGERAAFFTYEESADQIWPRLVICYMRKWERSEIFGKPISELSLEQQEKIEEARTILRERVLLADMSLPGQGQGGIDELATVLSDMKVAGKSPSLVIVDHVHPMAMRSLVTAGKGDDSLRHEIFRIADGFRTLTEQLSFTGILINQMNAQANVSVTRKPHHTDSAECRGFANHLHFCMNLGVQDPVSHVAALTLTKARNAPVKMNYLVRIDGAHCRVVSVEGQYVEDPRVQGRYVEKDRVGIQTACQEDGGRRVIEP